jgi:formylglycine-generating enzyme required for sulfatase activity
MVLISSGSFSMGSPDNEPGREADEGPQHQVSISSFYIGKYEVTQAQWRAVAKLPKVEIDLKPDPSSFKGDTLPVETINWLEAVEFCQRLSKASGKTYRLPTEAEWEYACRAGTTGPYAGDLNSMGWIGNPNDKTHPVGAKQPNALQLFDMHGNVWEWCADWYAADYYRQSPGENPPGPAAGGERVIRGGSYFHFGAFARSANRQGYKPESPNRDLGFRLVMTVN